MPVHMVKFKVSKCWFSANFLNSNRTFVCRFFSSGTNLCRCETSEEIFVHSLEYRCIEGQCFQAELPKRSTRTQQTQQAIRRDSRQGQIEELKFCKPRRYTSSWTTDLQGSVYISTKYFDWMNRWHCHAPWFDTSSEWSCHEEEHRVNNNSRCACETYRRGTINLDRN